MNTEIKPISVINETATNALIREIGIVDTIRFINSTLSYLKLARHACREAGIQCQADGKLETIHGAWIPAIHAGELD